MIGTGIILNIQDDKTIQALINRPVLEHQDILDKLADNDSKIISRTVIKPTIGSIL